MIAVDANFGSVVQIPACAMPYIRQQRSLSDTMAAQTVRDEAPRLVPQPLLTWQCRPCVS